MNTNPNTPDRKVAVGGAAGALTVLIVWGVSFTGIEVPAEVASAFTVLVTFAAAYFTPRRSTP